ncbi:hypothetical protein HA402_003202, partial [Bradysia odoriphaga]
MAKRNENIFDEEITEHKFTSHPKYRAALKEKLPMLVCGETDNAQSETASQNTTVTADGKA